jgi:hypothetical protein
MASHLGESRLDPAPRCHSCTVEGHQELEERAFNILEHPTGFLSQEGQVPLHRSSACILEVDPTQALWSGQAVSVVWLSVDGSFGEGHPIQPARELFERLSEKVSILCWKRRHSDVVEECNSCSLKARPEARQLDIDPSQCFVNEAK